MNGACFRNGISEADFDFDSRGRRDCVSWGRGVAGYLCVGAVYGVSDWRFGCRPAGE
jgi:hypothetical protein